MRRAPRLFPVVVLLLANPTQAEISPWFELSAPAGVFATAGLPDSVEPAFALLTLIRVSHATPASDEAARLRSAVEDASQARPPFRDYAAKYADAQGTQGTIVQGWRKALGIR